MVLPEPVAQVAQPVAQGATPGAAPGATPGATPASRPAWRLEPARVTDVPAIAELIRPFAERDLMLPRPLPQLYDTLRDFRVARALDAHAQPSGALVGCVALHVFDAELGEIKSLAVADAAQGSGLGSALVQQALADAATLGLPRVFALVLRVGFFERLGFRVVDKAELPQKVWGECIYCPKFHRCDEIAVVRELSPEQSPERSLER